MTLAEYLERHPDDRPLYIGARAGFFWSGYKRDLDLKEIDKRLSKAKRKRLLQARQRAHKFEKIGNLKRAATAKEFAESLEGEYVPIGERKVLSIWQRVMEEATNIKIEGQEPGT